MASLNAIRTLTTRAKLEGGPEMEAGLKRIASAQDAVTQTSVKQEKQTLSVDAAYQRLQRRYDQEFRAQQDLAKVQKTLDQARAQGLITQQRSSELMQAAIKVHNGSAQAATVHAKAIQAANDNLQMFASRLGPVGSLVASFGTTGLIAAGAVGALAAGFGLAAKAAIDMADKAGRLRDFSDTTGFTVKQLQALTIAGQDVGLSADEVAQGLERFSVAFEEIKTASGAAFTTLKQIDPVLAGQIARADGLTKAYDLYAQALAKADLTQRNLLARQVGGRGGIPQTRLAGAVNDAGGVDALANSVNKLGLITDEQAKHWDDLGDAITKNLGLAKTAITSTFTEQTLTGLKAMSESLRDIAFTVKGADWENNGFLNFMSRLVTFTATMLPGINVLVSGLKTIQSFGQTAAPLQVTTGSGGSIGPQLPPEHAERLQKAAAAAAFLRDETVRLANESRALMGVLGAAATPAEVLKDKFLQLDKAVAEDATMSDAAAKAKARLNAEFKSQQLQNNVAALGNAATAAEVYAAQVDKLRLQLDKGEISQSTFNRAVQQLSPTVQQLQNVVGDLGSALAQAFINGQDGADALHNSLKAVAATASSAAINNLIKGDFASAAVSATIAAGSFLASSLFGGKSQEQKDAEAKAAAEAEQRRLQAIADAADSQIRLIEFTQRASVASLRPGSLSAQLSAFDFQSQAQFQAESQKAFNQIPALIAAVTAERNALVTGVIQSNRDILNQGGLSDVAKRLEEIATAGAEMSQALAELGASTAEASNLVAAATARLKKSFEDDLIRGINDAQGKGFLNQFADLFKQVEQSRQDAARLGTSSSLVDRFFGVSAQKIVDDAGLIGDSFNELIATFPQLAGVVHESTKALQDAADAQQRIIDQQVAALNQAGRGIADYINSLLAGPQSTQSPSARLASAQSTYNATLALAQANNIDALNRVTSDFENLRTAAKDFFGTGAGYQQILAQGIAQLSALPAVAASTDPIVNALLGTTAAVQQTTAAVNTVKAAQDATAALVASQNALQTTANSIQNTANTFLNSMNSLLGAINAQTAFLSSSHGHLQVIRSNSKVIADNTSEQWALKSNDVFDHHDSLGGAGTAALGGWITGGTPGKDSVPMMLMPGEYVIRASEAQKFGSLLESINAGLGMPSMPSAPSAWSFASANDNNAVVSELRRLTSVVGSLLSRIAQLEEENVYATERNTAHRGEQAEADRRESRIAIRKAG
jgi:hypothetical protein